MDNGYGKFIFLSKESEDEWDNMTEEEKDAVSAVLAHNIRKNKKKIVEDRIKEIKDCPVCKQRASDYEWMFLEQKSIATGYREIIEELQKKLEVYELKK